MGDSPAIEVVYRAEAERLWRALVGYSGSREIAMPVYAARHETNSRREGEAPYRVGRLRRESASIVTAPRSTRAVTMNCVDASKPTKPMPL